MKAYPLDERLNLIEIKISDENFRRNEGLGNEVGYYVFDYDPRQELLVRNHIRYLIDKINNGHRGFKILEFDLFHLMTEILEEEGYLGDFFELEKEKAEELSGRDGGKNAGVSVGFMEVAESLVETLGLDETDEQNLIISKFMEADRTDSVIFVTGLGKCHPIIQGHNILNNLHQVLDDVPVILFYPGVYTGQELRMFGTIASQNYYRAFHLC